MTKKRVIALLITLLLVFAIIPGLISLADALKKVKAYQFVVDGEVWFTIADTDRDALENMLSEYQKSYLKNVDQNARIKKISFVQAVELVNVEVKPEELDSLDTARERIYAIEEEALEIEIKSGDNFWNLARAHKMSVADLQILNPDVNPDKIYPGDILLLRPLNPVLDVMIQFENMIIEPVPFKVETRKDNTLYTSQKYIIREGVEGEKEVLYDITLLNGFQNSLVVMNENVIKEPVNALVRVGTKTTVSRGGRVNYGVVQGKRISSHYGWRIHPITGRRKFHDGLDIAANTGTPVYVYTDGKIIQAGWNGGYGLSILVDHGNGLRTRYAHLSKIYVKVGQRVKTGERIGAVGSTGNSTGPHLHFEVIKNGQTKNPLNYI
ncbi:MAG: M23 family metallopeptidase [Firmicutes bacterium]|nr:M23 family metallopeptidase [Bacillota bacterium]